jgi:putative transposase
MCKVLQVSKSGYYSSVNKKITTQQLKTEQIKSEIQNIYYKFECRYGSPRIHKELETMGYQICRQTVAKYMRQMSLRSIIQKKYKVCTTDSSHNYLVADNILNRQFKTTATNQAWVSDITYIPTMEGWLFLTIVLDLYDRKIIGWAFSDTMHTRQTTIKAFIMAKTNRKIWEDQKLIFHSDRGSQYACYEFKQELEHHPNIVQSMSRKGNCWDNAVAESFFKTIKSELTNHYNFTTIKQAENAVFEYIECFYNTTRRHSTLNNQTINEFWNSINIAA